MEVKREFPQKAVIISEMTIRQCLDIWMENFANNLPEIKAGKDIRELKPVGGPALVVGAGPSISKYKQLDTLVASNFRKTIIATDKMLIPLLKKNIVPQYVVCVDGYAECLRYFNDPLVEKHKDEIKAIFTTFVHPSTISTFKGEKYFFHTAMDDHKKPDSLTRAIYYMTKNTIVPCCFPKGTKVLMSAGFEKPIEKINKGESVVTSEGNAEVVELYNRNYEKMVGLDCVGIEPIESTDDHLFWVIKREQLLCKRRNSTERGYRLCTKLGKKFAKSVKACYYCKEPLYNKVIPEFLPAKDIKKGDFLLSPVEINWYFRELDSTLIKNPINEKNIDPEIMRIFGLYLAEGSIHYKGERVVGMTFHFGITEDDLIAEVEKVFKQKFGLQVSKYYNKSKNACNVEVNNVKMAKWFEKLLGRYSDGKKICPEIMFLDNELLIELFKGYADGDAHFRNGTINIKTVSENLAGQIWWILAKSGYILSVRKYKGGYTNKDYPNKDYFCLFLNSKDSNKILGFSSKGKIRRFFVEYNKKKFIANEVRTIKRFDKKTEVYNLSVLGNNTFIANKVITHNCGDCGSTSWKVAHGLHCNPIALIGMDLSEEKLEELFEYYQMLKHFPEEKVIRKENEIITKQQDGQLLQAFRRDYNPDFKNYSWTGIVWDSCWQTFRNWIELVNKELKVVTINCSGQGVIHGSTVVGMPFEEFLKKHG